MRIALTLLLCVSCVGLMATTTGGRLGDMTPHDFALDASLDLGGRYRTVNKYGEATDLDAAATDVWDGAEGGNLIAPCNVADFCDLWMPPTVARTHFIASSDVADDDWGTKGTGLRTIMIYGLTDWDDTAETTEVIRLDGNSDSPTPNAVPTVNQYVIIYRMRGTTQGTGGVNAGNITAMAETDGTLTAAILSGNRQTKMAIYGVSSTMRLRVTEVTASLLRGAGVSATVDADLMWMDTSDPNATVDNTQWTHMEDFGFSDLSGWDRRYGVPKAFDGPGILKVQMVGSSPGGHEATASFDAYVVDD